MTRPSNRPSTFIAILIIALFAVVIHGCGSAPSNPISTPTGDSTSAADDAGTGDNQEEQKENNTDSTNPTNGEETETEETTERPAPTVQLTSSDQAWTAEIVVDDASNDASGWEVRWRKQGETQWSDWTSQAFPSEESESPSHTESDLQNGATYEIEVRLTFNNGASSAISQATAKPYTTPGAVENLASESANERLEISFDTPLSTGGATVTGYRYRYRIQGGETWTAWESATATPIEINNLTNRRTYDVEVVAVNEAGNGPLATVSGTPDWALLRLEPPSESYDGFGWDFDVDGEHLVVTGNPDGTSGLSHHATFFRRINNQYVQTTKLQNSILGVATAISGNRAVLEIKRPLGGNVNILKNRAIAYRYEPTSNQWTFEYEFVLDWAALADGPGAYDIAMDANRVAIASFSTHDQFGKAQVFEVDETGIWRSLGSPIKDHPREDLQSRFGFTVDLHENLLVVGAPGAPDGLSRERNGRVTVYQWNASSGSWDFQQELTNESKDGFGAGLHLTRDRLVVGAPEGNKAFVYERSGQTDFTFVSEIPAPGGIGSGFGYSVTSYGNLIAIGRAYINQAGHTFLYEETEGGWDLVGELVNERVSNQAQSGAPVILKENRLYVGAFAQNNEGTSTDGQVLIFDDVSNRYQAP
jgi:hypothetical protein